MRRAFILGLLLLASGARAQVLRVDSAAGNYIGDGVGATYYMPNWTARAAVGYSQGRMLFQLSDDFEYKGLTVGLGTEQVSLNNISLIGTGLTVSKKTKRSKVVFFAGMTNTQSKFVLMQANLLPQNFGAGFLYQFEVSKNLLLSEMAAIDGSKKSDVASASYHNSRFSALGEGGLLNGQAYVSAVGSAHLSIIYLGVGHQEYTVPMHASVDSANLNANWRWFNASAGLNAADSATKVKGENASAGVQLGMFSETSAYYRTGKSALILHTLAERLPRHIVVSENISQSQGHISLNVGGGYTSNRFSVSILRQVQFLVTGYQQTTAVQATIRLPGDTAMRVSTITNPFGKTVWNAGSATYESVGSVAVQGHQVSGSVGAFVIQGTCEQSDGSKVEGCQIIVDKTPVLSDSHGQWEYRQRKNKPVTIHVDPGTFVAPGSWELVSAPEGAKAGEIVRVIVRRKQ